MNAAREEARHLRIMIIYYSRGGRTRRAAEELAKALVQRHDVTVTELRPRRPLNLVSGLLLTRRRLAAEIQPFPVPNPVDLVYLGTPIWAGQVHALAWGYVAAGPVRAPHVLFATSAGGDNEAGGMRRLEQAITARGHSVLAVVDMKSPTMLEERVPVLVEVTRQLSDTPADPGSLGWQ